MSGFLAELQQFIVMAVMLFNMCNSNEFNRQACMKDWDTWLIPELVRAWNIKTGKEIPYQNEENMVEWHQQQ